MARRRQQVEAVQYENLEKALAEMSTKSLLCRDLGHNWVNYKAERGSHGGFEATMRCSRGCGLTKERYIDGDGYIVGSKSHYEDKSYLLTGFGRATKSVRATARLTLLGKL